MIKIASTKEAKDRINDSEIKCLIRAPLVDPLSFLIPTSLARLLARAVEMVAGQPGLQLERQVTTRYDSKHFAFALQPEGRYCQLGLGVRVG